MSTSKDEEKIQAVRTYVPFVEKMIEKMESHKRQVDNKKLILKLKELHKYLINPHLDAHMADIIENFLKKFKTSKYCSSKRLNPKVSGEKGQVTYKKTDSIGSSLIKGDQSTDSEDEITILCEVKKSNENQKANESRLDVHKELSTATSASGEFSLTDNLLEIDTSKYKSKANPPRPLNTSAVSELDKFGTVDMIRLSRNTSNVSSKNATSYSHFGDVNEMGITAVNRKSESVFLSPYPITSPVNTGHDFRLPTRLDSTLPNESSLISVNASTESHFNAPQIPKRNCSDSPNSSLYIIPSSNANLDIQGAVSSPKLLTSSSQAANFPPPNYQRNHSNVEAQQSLRYDSTLILESLKDSSDNRNSFTNQSSDLISNGSSLPPVQFEKILNALSYLNSLDENSKAEDISYQCENVFGPGESNSVPDCDPKEVQQSIDKQLSDKAVDLLNENSVGMRDTHTPGQFIPSIISQTQGQITNTFSLPDSRLASHSSSYPSNFHPASSSDLPPDDSNTNISIFPSRESRNSDTEHLHCTTPQQSLNYPSNFHPASSSDLLPDDSNTNISIFPSRESRDSYTEHLHCTTPRQSLNFEEIRSPINSNTSINSSKNSEPRKVDVIRSRIANAQDKPIQLGQKGVVVSQVERYKQKREKYPLFSKQSSTTKPSYSSNSNYRKKSFSIHKENERSVSFRDEPIHEGEINDAGISVHNNIKNSRDVNIPNQNALENHQSSGHRPVKPCNSNSIGGSFSSGYSNREKSNDLRSSSREVPQKDSVRDSRSDNRRNTRPEYISRDPRSHAQGYRDNYCNRQFVPYSRDHSLIHRRHSNDSRVNSGHYVQANASRNEYPPALNERVDNLNLSPLQANSYSEIEGDGRLQVFQKDRRLDKMTSARGHVRRSFPSHTGFQLPHYSGTPYYDTFSPIYTQCSKIVNSFTCLVMQGLPSCTNSSHIYKFFEQYLLRDLCIELTDAYKCKGTAYVLFPTHACAKEAFKNENGKTINNHKIYLEIGYVGALKQANKRHGVQNFDRERFLDIPSRPVGTGNPFYNPGLNPELESHPLSSSVPQKSTDNEKCIEEPALAVQSSSDDEECIEEPNNDEPLSTENYSSTCVVNVDSKAKRLKNFKIPKVKDPSSVHDHMTKTVESKSKQVHTKTANLKTTSNENEPKKRKCSEVSSNSEHNNNLNVSSRAKKDRKYHRIIKPIDSDSDFDFEKDDTPTIKSVSKSPNYSVDRELDEHSFTIAKSIAPNLEFSENESDEPREQSPINETITKTLSPVDKGRNMTSKIQPLKLNDKSNIKSKKRLSTTQRKQHGKKMQVNKANAKSLETKITRLKHNNLKKNLSPQKKVKIIIPKPLKFVYCIASKKLLEKTRVENSPFLLPTNKLSGVEFLDSFASKKNSSSTPLPQFLECPKTVTKEYFETNNKQNFTSTPKKRVMICEELESEIEQNSVMDTDDELPDLM